MDVLPGKIAEASKVLSGLLFDPVFEEEKLALERKVILNEIAEVRDDPQNLVGEALLKCLFKQHPLKNPILGFAKTINQFTVDDVAQVHQNFFVPQNMVLMLTGNFSGKDTENVLENFQNRENNCKVSRRNRKPEESKPKKEVGIEKSGLTQSYLNFGLQNYSSATCRCGFIGFG